MLLPFFLVLCLLHHHCRTQTVDLGRKCENRISIDIINHNKNHQVDNHKTICYRRFQNILPVLKPLSCEQRTKNIASNRFATRQMPVAFIPKEKRKKVNFIFPKKNFFSAVIRIHISFLQIRKQKLPVVLCSCYFQNISLDVIYLKTDWIIRIVSCFLYKYHRKNLIVAM